MTKPSLFIASSTEGLEVARAARSLLEQDAEITLWKEAEDFALGTTIIEGLLNALPRFDFAIIVFTRDDLVSSRGLEQFGPRDNVLFELGLFMGRLGRSRTFILHQVNADLKIPIDLSGLITATYEWPRMDGNIRAAVGAACDKIRKAVRDLGVSELKASKAINDIRLRQKKQEDKLSSQQAAIRSLQVALQGIITKYEYDKLTGLNNDEPFMCYYSDDLVNEMKRLRAMGLVLNYEGKGLSTIRNNYKDRNRQFDLKQFFYLTEQGNEYLGLRAELMKGTGEEE